MSFLLSLKLKLKDINISNKGLLPLEKKTDAITKLDHPMNITELRSFLGMVGYYRNFIENYALLSFPLCKLLKKKFFT